MKNDGICLLDQLRQMRPVGVMVMALALVAASCGGSDQGSGTPTAPTDPPPVAPPPSTGSGTPTVPSNYGGRCVEVMGTVTVTSPNVTFQVWDDATIDGDVVSLIVNGNSLLNQITLDGPGNKRSVTATLNPGGYSYVILYAHNEGTVPPNTAALSVNDGRTTQDLVLSANLSTNGAYNIVVGSAPPAPPRPACPVSPTTPTNPSPPNATTMRWTLTDACADGRGLQARFFDKTNNLVWPADSTKVFVTPSGGMIDVPLSASAGANICFGAEPDPANNQYWGLGIRGTNSCADCCYSAANTTIRINLTCQ